MRSAIISGGVIKTPVALVLFNRPDLVQSVFERVAGAKPEKLFLIADGPRPDKPDDPGLCERARGIVSAITWPAEVHINFSQINLGCGRRIASGLDWVFSRVPEAIVLEDDCLPAPEFFPFCEEMLERYRDDKRIGIISGDNFAAPKFRCPDSYYFSRYPHIWGWATWRRTWEQFDFQLSKWPRFREAGLLGEVTRRPETVRFWREVFDHQRVWHTAWASRMVFTCFVNGLLNVLPEQNLVSNVGFGTDATHAVDLNSPLANMPVGSLDFPLRHPEFFIPFREADEHVEAAQFSCG
jgi:hypothetical protein